MQNSNAIVVEYDGYAIDLSPRQLMRIHQMASAVDWSLKREDLGRMETVTFKCGSAFEIEFSCEDSEKAFWAIAPTMYQYDFMVDGFSAAKEYPPTTCLIGIDEDGELVETIVDLEDYFEQRDHFAHEVQSTGQDSPAPQPVIEAPEPRDFGLFTYMKNLWGKSSTENRTLK